MIELSVIVPGIRTKNWKDLYDSVVDSFGSNFEIIFVGPYDLPEELKLDNVKYIKDYGSPARAMNIGLENSVGKYVTWAADDGIFLKNELKNVYNKMELDNEKHIITCKYIEGSGIGVGITMYDDKYYLLSASLDCSRLHVNPNQFIFNVGLINTEYLKKIGGWEGESFEVAVGGYIDLAIRLYNDNCKMELYPDVIYKCTHMPNTSGDHAPIHYAYILNDLPKLNEIYQNPNSRNRIIIDINNWKNSPDRWTRRFGEL